MSIRWYNSCVGIRKPFRRICTLAGKLPVVGRQLRETMADCMYVEKPAGKARYASTEKWKGRDNMNRFDTMGKDALSRVEEIMNSTKLNEFLHRKEEEEKKKTCILWILAIIGVVAAVAAIAYGVYRFFTPDYLEDFEDDFDDDFDDDFFEDEDEDSEK